INSNYRSVFYDYGFTHSIFTELVIISLRVFSFLSLTLIALKGRIFKCKNFGMEYGRDSNTCVKIAYRPMSPMEWRSLKP
ncbi:MAG: hypothetical protein QW265_02645, partial [Candidatus Bathyarchaeia archaeon]